MRVIGGWEWHGTARIQSGSPFNFGNVDLVGMTVKELQDVVKSAKKLLRSYFLPDDIIDNTKRAFGSLAGQSDREVHISDNPHPSGLHMLDSTEFELVLYGPNFSRFDLCASRRRRSPSG